MRATTIEGQNAFAPKQCFEQVSREDGQKHVIRLRVIEGPIASDQIAFFAFLSFLAEVQTNPGYIHATHA